MFLLMLLACGEVEGDEGGECSDGADNDLNGLFDCDDEGCQGSPDCAESDADTDADTDTDTDTDADADSDSDTDSDTDTDVSDLDGDGYSEEDGDCDDSDAWVHPDGTDGLLADRDCDDTVLYSDLSDADAVIQGGSGFGMALDADGDIDGDGLADLVLAGRVGDSASVYVYLGKNLSLGSSLEPSDADYEIRDLEWSSDRPIDVAWVGDLRQDGTDALVVGVSQSNCVYVWTGSAFGTARLLAVTDAYWTICGGTDLGFSVDDIGDIDGDTVPDFAVGDPYSSPNGANSGTAYVVLSKLLLAGQAHRSVGDVSHTVQGMDAADLLGWSVAGIGDYNGDSVPDMLLGSPRFTTNAWEQGTAFVVSGADVGDLGTTRMTSSANHLPGLVVDENMGSVVAGLGDVDGDGRGDLSVSSPVAGRVIVGLSHNGTTDFTAEFDQHRVGVGMSSAGDLDGDGLTDFYVAADYNADYGVGAGVGVVHVMLSKDFNGELTDASLVVKGDPSRQLGAGRTIANGDLNGDGHPDVAIGAPGDADDGRVYVLFSRPLTR